MLCIPTKKMGCDPPRSLGSAQDEPSGDGETWERGQHKCLKQHTKLKLKTPSMQYLHELGLGFPQIDLVVLWPSPCSGLLPFRPAGYSWVGNQGVPGHTPELVQVVWARRSKASKPQARLWCQRCSSRRCGCSPTPGVGERRVQVQAAPCPFTHCIISLTHCIIFFRRHETTLNEKLMFSDSQLHWSL